MRTLNRSYRGKDYATDVLSFPASPPPEPAAVRRGADYLGDIVIATGVAQRQAEQVGHAVAR